MTPNEIKYIVRRTLVYRASDVLRLHADTWPHIKAFMGAEMWERGEHGDAANEFGGAAHLLARRLCCDVWAAYTRAQGECLIKVAEVTTDREDRLQTLLHAKTCFFSAGKTSHDHGVNRVVGERYSHVADMIAKLMEETQ